MDSFVQKMIHLLTIWDPKPDWEEEVLPDYNVGDLLVLREKGVFQ